LQVGGVEFQDSSKKQGELTAGRKSTLHSRLIRLQTR